MPLKTTITKKSVKSFVDSIENKSKRADVKSLVSLIQKITKKQPKIWGNNFIIGFGEYNYCRKNSNDKLEWFNIGLAPRKTNITLYLTCYLDKEPLVKKLGRCKYGKGCLYIKKLTDIDLSILKKLIVKYKDNRWGS